MAPARPPEAAATAREAPTSKPLVGDARPDSAWRLAVDLLRQLSNFDPAVRDLLTRAVADAEAPAVRTNPPVVQKQTRLSRSQADELVEAYRQGASLQQLCRTWQVGKDTIYRHLRSAGIEPSRYAEPESDVVTEARRRYESGLSLKAVGERVGLSPESVRKYLAKAGVEIRLRRGWPLLL